MFSKDKKSKGHVNKALTKEERIEFEILLRSSYTVLYFRILNNTRNKEKTEDILQDTVIEGYTHFRDLRDKAKFEKWISRIAHNLCMKDFKKNKVKGKDNISRDRIEYVGDINAEYASDFEVPTALSTEAEVIIAESKSEIRECIKSLNSLQRKIIYLFHYCGIQLTDIADMYKINYNTVASNHKRALEALEAKLSKEEVDEFLHTLSEQEEFR